MLMLSVMGAVAEFFYPSHSFSGLWLVVLVGFGWLVHTAGDYLTRGGIPLCIPKERDFLWQYLEQLVPKWKPSLERRIRADNANQIYLSILASPRRPYRLKLFG